MRTQKILVAAATLAVSLATSMADPVYSQNIVGYINLTIKPGFNLLANQLNSGSGSNSLDSVFPGRPDGDSIYKFNPVSGSFSIDIVDLGAWVDSGSGNPSTTTVNPGEGFFYFTTSPSDQTVTLVGSVQTGTNTVNVNSGFSLIASVTPESYELTGTNFPAADGFTYYHYAAGNFAQSYFDVSQWVDPGSGNPVTVKPGVGDGFFMFNPGSAVNWTRAFNP